MKNLNRIIEYGLYLLVFLLPWQTRWIIRGGEINSGYSEYLTLSLYGTDILLLILLALFVIFKIKDYGQDKKKEFKIEQIWYLIAGLELMVFISIFFAPNKLLAVYTYARFLLGLGLFWIIVGSEIKRIKLIYAFLTGVFLQAGLGIWQFLTQSSFADKWLGLAAHNPGDLGVSVVETLSGERWLRAYGGLDHPNMLGGLMVVGLLLTIELLIKNNSAGRPARQDTRNKKQDTNKLQIPIIKSRIIFLGALKLIIVCILILLTALFFTFSRAAWLGIFIGVGVMLGMAVIKKDLPAQKKILEIILIGGGLIFLLFNIYGDLATARLAENTRLEVKSNTDRIESLEGARAIIRNKWLLGAGIGNYVKYSAGLINFDSADKCQSDWPAWSFQPAHNVFLLVWSEIGIIGLIFFIGILFWPIKRALNREKYAGGKNNLYQIGVLAAMLTMFMFDHWWWSLHFGVLLFWLVMGIIIMDTEKEKI